MCYDMSMKSVGIIAEYNPFHDGHRYQIEQSREMTGADVVVACMSGDFVQRGGPAAFDKWTRARMAVENGVNLVVELPTVYASSSAEYFAKGGVSVLAGLGMIDYLSFGSECGDIERLKSVAASLEMNHKLIHQRIQELIKEGLAYPKARQMAAKGLLENPEDIYILDEPNNILAIEYLKQLNGLEQAEDSGTGHGGKMAGHGEKMAGHGGKMAQCQHMIPITVKRVGDGHHSSSTKIREGLLRDKTSGYGQAMARYFDFARAKALLADAADLENAFSSGEGLGNRLKNEIRYAKNIEGLISMVKSKGYTYTRVSRLLAQALLGITVESVLEAKPYIRVLAFDDGGARFLKEVKKRECGSIPIITNINKDVRPEDEIFDTLAVDIKAADMYNLILGADLYANSDYVVRPYANLGKGLEK